MGKNIKTLGVHSPELGSPINLATKSNQSGLTEMMYEVEILQNDKSRLENEINLIKCKESELVKAERTKHELRFEELRNKMNIIQANSEGTKEFIVNLNAENNELKNQVSQNENQLGEINLFCFDRIFQNEWSMNPVAQPEKEVGFPKLWCSNTDI